MTDGELGWDNGEYPLNHAILGGKQLYNGDEEIVALVLPHQVKDVADALQAIDDAELEQRYWRINSNNYGFAPEQQDADDLKYIQEYFAELKLFYIKSAAATRAIVFTADQ